MKILMISPIPVLPVVEGNRSRILTLGRAIREQGHELWFLLAPAWTSPHHDREAHLVEFGADRFAEVPQDGPLARFLRRLPFRLRRKTRHLLRLPGRHYGGLDALRSHKWNRYLTDLQHRHGFDVVVVEYVMLSGIFGRFPPKVRRIIDTHDSFADRHRSYLARGVNEYFYSLRPQDETRGLRRADAILAIQPQEAEGFLRQLGAHPRNPGVFTVNHFLDLAEPPIADHSARCGLFLASRNPANTLSAQVFISQVLPRVLARMPDFRLVLAGMICEVIDDHPAIVKLGRVDRLSEAFRQAPVLLNPMQIGTGINIKLLDALAAGVPTISTETGARGLDSGFRDSVQVVGDHEHEEFADQIVALMGDVPRRRALGRIARDDAVRWNEAQHAALHDALNGQQGS